VIISTDFSGQARYTQASERYKGLRRCKGPFQQFKLPKVRRTRSGFHMNGAKDGIPGWWDLSIEGQSDVLCMVRWWSETSGAFCLTTSSHGCASRFDLCAVCIAKGCMQQRAHGNKARRQTGSSISAISDASPCQSLCPSWSECHTDSKRRISVKALSATPRSSGCIVRFE
jgi:hypothetical protein